MSRSLFRNPTIYGGRCWHCELRSCRCPRKRDVERGAQDLADGLDDYEATAAFNYDCDGCDFCDPSRDEWREIWSGQPTPLTVPLVDVLIARAA